MNSTFVYKFYYYLDDMFNLYGRVSEAVDARIGSAWEKFRG